MPLACDLATLATTDTSDLDAVQNLLDVCTSALDDPALWWWTIGITVGFGLVGAWIGWRKGRWLSGMIWGLLLGPIGWLIVALSRSVRCAACGRTNPAKAKFCQHCGAGLRTATSSTWSESGASEPVAQRSPAAEAAPKPPDQ